MRIAFVSDIHGNLPALQAVVQDIARRGVTQVVDLGDMLSGPLLPLETARYLMAQDWLHISGNHERQLLDLPPERQGASDAFATQALDAPARDWLRDVVASTDPRLHEATLWPDRLGHDLALCHGSPRSDLEYLLETPRGEAVQLSAGVEVEERLGGRVPAHIGLLACGHSHVPRAVRLSSGLLIVNPGSVGLPAYDDDHPHPHSSYHRVENGSPDARYAIAEKTGVGWQAELISVPYDFEPMAALADRHGQPGWAHALRTGYMPRPAKTATL
jgi:predicted phosphodiesterase